MSDQFQKTFVSVREFVESWDKEIYKLTNLDYFIYLMVNHLGNQLEKRFFVQSRQNSRLALSFESIGTLCFNIGDSFEYFLEEDCFGRYSVDYRIEPEAKNETVERNREVTQQRIKSLQSLVNDGFIKEQNFRVDLMEYVVMDTLLQFYYEEIGIEFGEDDLEIMELADFIEDVIITYIRSEGRTLLQRHGDPAIDNFEKLLEAEEDYQFEDDPWDESEDVFEESGDDWEDSDAYYEGLNDVFQAFIEASDGHPAGHGGCAACDIGLFKEYLVKQARIGDILDLSEEHLCEFLSVWLIKHFAQEEAPKFTHIFQTMARFVNWLNQIYGLDFRRSFVKFYENVKTETPRALEALNAYLEEYDLFDVLLYRGRPDITQASGSYEVKKIRSRMRKTLDLANIHFFDEFPEVRLNSAICSRLKTGDILQATLIQKDDEWEVLEIHYVFPKIARPYVFF